VKILSKKSLGTLHLVVEKNETTALAVLTPPLDLIVDVESLNYCDSGVKSAIVSRCRLPTNP
jgi:hypothetical protein